MKGEFGETFAFLANLAWRNRKSLPILISVVFLIMDFNMQVRFSIRSGEDQDDMNQDDSDNNDEEFSTDDENDSD